MKNLVLMLSFALVSSISVSSLAEEARFLVSDSEALQARVDVLQQAKKEILVEYYSVWNDDQAVGGMTLLIDAARRGIKVKVILDAISNTVPLSLFATLVEKGRGPNGEKNLEVKLYNPISLNLKNLTHRTHAKMIVVDGEVLITGGRNVGDKYFGLNGKRNYHDLDIMLRGNVVQDARKDFLAVWSSPIAQPPRLLEFSEERLAPDACAWKEDMGACEMAQKYALEKIEDERKRLRTSFEEIVAVTAGDIVAPHTNTDWFKDSVTVDDIRFISHQPDKLVSRKRAHLSDALLKAVKATESEINIVSPYLMPTPNLMAAFEALRAKGVRIRVITNSLKSTDNLFAQAGYRLLKPQLVKMGVEIWEYNGPHTIHAKTALIDGKHVLVGTFNIDPRSTALNREIGISIMDSKAGPLASQLESIIEDFRSNSVLVAKDGEHHNREWQAEGISIKKELTLKALLLVTPFILNQL